MRAVAWYLGLSFILVGCQSSTPVVTPKTKEILSKEASDGGYTLLGTEELAERVKNRTNMILIDTTPHEHFQRHHILGATHYLFPAETEAQTWEASKFGGPDPDDFARRLGTDKNLPVVVYAEDTHSLRSHHAATWAKKLGFNQVYRYAEGITGWLKDGNETRTVEE